jgi:hypothetical protein
MAMGFPHRDTSRSPRKQQIRRLSFLLRRLAPVNDIHREGPLHFQQVRGKGNNLSLRNVAKTPQLAWFGVNRGVSDFIPSDFFDKTKMRGTRVTRSREMGREGCPNQRLRSSGCGWIGRRKVSAGVRSWAKGELYPSGVKRERQGVAEIQAALGREAPGVTDREHEHGCVDSGSGARRGRSCGTSKC